LFSLFPCLITMSAGFIFLFSYRNTEYILHIHSHSLFYYVHTVPLVPTPEKNLFYPSVLNYFKCVVTVQGWFTLVLQAWIYSALIKLSPPLLTLSLSLCLPNIQQLTVQYIILYSNIDGLFQHYSFSNIFPSSTTCSPLRKPH
jgi:hypothetical protein